MLFRSDALAFRTRTGVRLIHPTKKGKSDSVAQLWRKLIQNCHNIYGVQKLSFKYLRKTLSQAIRDKMGLESAKMFCAHAIQDVQDQNYTKGNFEQVIKVIREEIYPVWKIMFDKADLQKLAEEFEAKEKASKDIKRAA